MALAVEGLPGLEEKWDLPYQLRNPNNLTSCFVFSKRLSPTAGAAANWALKTGGSTLTVIWDIDFASDTAIEYNMGPAPNPGYTAGFIGTYGNVNPTGGGSAATSQAQVAASSALLYTYQGGFAPPNQTIHLLNKNWIVLPASTVLYLFTTQVVANCILNIYFAEFAQS